MTFQYEPPRGNLPAGITTGRLYGQFLRAVDDSTDVGIGTDSIPAQGFLKFFPEASYVNYGENLILLDQRIAYLTPTGDFEIDLVATDNTSPTVNWAYGVEFHIDGLTIPPFRLLVPSGSDRALSEVVPITTQDATVVVKGDKGDKGDMSIVGLNVFVDAQGDLAVDDTRLFYWGSGTPNGVVTAGKGCYYTDLDAGITNFMYYKSTATGNTGWVVVK